MKEHILITGGAGFIGVNLVNALIEKGYSITVLDSLLQQVHGENPAENSVLYNSIKNKVQFIHGCITNEQLLKEAIQKANIIVHFAAETGTGQSMYEIERYTHVNIQGTALLLQLLANEQHNVKKVVVASSRAIYGEGKYYSKTKGVVYPNLRSNTELKKGNFAVEYEGDFNLQVVATDENSKIHPTSVYGITKQVQEQLIMTVCPTIGIAPVALRYQNVYGPGQSLSNPYTGILSIFSTRIRTGHSINIFEDGTESRDFVYIDDVIDATVKAIENSNANGEVFNVGSGVSTSVENVLLLLMEKMQTKVPYTISGNYRLGDIRHCFADVQKINSLLGFIPKVSFEEGVQKFVYWVNQQNTFVDLYEKSLDEMRTKKMLQ